MSKEPKDERFVRLAEARVNKIIKMVRLLGNLSWSSNYNIDFRRVRNLRIFFEEYAISLTLDINEIAEWQPGDIVIFENDKHIGIISDKRNKDGQPYVIHNGGQPNREEDYLSKSAVTGHYRFDASKIDEGILVKWE